MNFTINYSEEDEGYIARCDKHELLTGFSEDPVEALSELLFVIDEVEEGGIE